MVSKNNMATTMALSGIKLCVLTCLFSSIAAAVADAQLIASHGTCAIAIATKDDVVLVVDSRLTLASSITNSCTAPKIPDGCKASLVRKDVLVAVTGVYNDPKDGVNWKVADATNALIRELPPIITREDVRTFEEKWFRSLIYHYEGAQNRLPSNVKFPTGVSISTILFVTRIDNVPFVRKITISWDGYQFVLDSSELGITAHPGNEYAGSCHDNVGTHSRVGRYMAPFDPPNPAYKFEMLMLGDREYILAHSVKDFVDIAKGYEEVLAKVENSKNKCFIGPPYDVATWAKGEAGWTTNFKVRCRPKTSSSNNTKSGMRPQHG
jgi:hypothetical protein